MTRAADVARLPSGPVASRAPLAISSSIAARTLAMCAGSGGPLMPPGAETICKKRMQELLVNWRRRCTPERLGKVDAACPAYLSNFGHLQYIEPSHAVPAPDPLGRVTRS